MFSTVAAAGGWARRSESKGIGLEVGAGGIVPAGSYSPATNSMSHNSTPLAVTDEQLSMIYRAAQPLLPPDRLAFLAALADRLRGEAIVGDGSIARAIRELQRQFFRPPRGEAHAPKISIRDPGPAIER